MENSGLIRKNKVRTVSWNATNRKWRSEALSLKKKKEDTEDKQNIKEVQIVTSNSNYDVIYKNMPRRESILEAYII